MKVKVAIISPESFIENMMNVGKSFSALELLPYPYENMSETVDIVDRCKDMVDVLFFAGPIPYQLAYAHVENKPMIYLPHSGTSLYRALFQTFRETGFKDNNGLKLSIDVVDRQEAIEKIEELEIQLDSLYVHTFHIADTPREIATFHYQLWKSRKIDVALTCYHSVYQQLLELQVPCQRIYPSKSTIKESFHRALLEGRSVYLKGTQLAIGIIHIDSYSKNHDSAKSKSKKKCLLQKVLMNYGEEMEAVMERNKRDEIIFMTTRKNIEKTTKGFSEYPLTDQMIHELNLTISMGIGLGSTASDAELKAREALAKAKAGKDGSCYVMMQDGNVFGPLGQSQYLSYSARTDNPELFIMAKKAALSVGTMNKLVSYCQKCKKTILTAAELANGFGITVRSARRILNKLEDKGLAAVIGEEQPITKGRPRQIYDLNFAKLDVDNK